MIEKKSINLRIMINYDVIKKKFLIKNEKIVYL